MKILFAGDFAPCRGFEKIALDVRHDIFGDLRKDVSNADISFLIHYRNPGPVGQVRVQCLCQLYGSMFDIPGFKRYVGLSVLARNLQIMGHHIQQKGLKQLQRSEQRKAA